jgi:hypothetical protein
VQANAPPEKLNKALVKPEPLTATFGTVVPPTAPSGVIELITATDAAVEIGFVPELTVTPPTVTVICPIETREGICTTS